MKLRVRDHNARNPAWKTGREHASGSESRRAFAVVESCAGVYQLDAARTFRPPGQRVTEGLSMASDSLGAH